MTTNKIPLYRRCPSCGKDNGWAGSYLWCVDCINALERRVQEKHAAKREARDA